MFGENYIPRPQMTDEQIKRYYDQVNESGVSISFFFSPKNNLYIYIYIYSCITIDVLD